MKRFLRVIIVVLSLCICAQLMGICLSYLKRGTYKVESTKTIKTLMVTNGASGAEINKQLNKVYGDK